MSLRTNFMRCTARVLVAGALLALAGCDAMFFNGQATNQPLPPVAAGTGRVIFYRDLDYENTQATTTVYLNGAPTGVSQGGTMFYRDVAPGSYNVTVAPTLPYANQFATVTVKPGVVAYLEIGSLRNMGDMAPEKSAYNTFILSVVDPQLGAYETYRLRLIHG